MARITRIYVERLKSYGDYSNRRVGLEAVLDEGEDVKDVYMELARTCETLLEIQDIEAKTAALEFHIKMYEERKKELEKLREEYYQIHGELSKELSNLRKEIERILALAETKELRLKEEIIEKLKQIRDALMLRWYDP